MGKQLNKFKNMNNENLTDGWTEISDNMDWWEEYLKGTTIITKEDINEHIDKSLPINIIPKNTKLKIIDSFKFMIFCEDYDGRTLLIHTRDIRKFYTTNESKQIIRKEKLNNINEKIL